MYKEEICVVKSPCREDMVVHGYRFGKGEQSACILGSVRGNEMQQMYICSQLVRALKELEANGCINAGKSIMVIPVVNALGMNVSRRFFGVENMDINRMFPGKEDGDATDRIAFQIFEKIKGYTYGIQLTSFYMTGEFVPHVRMMETGYQNTSLANLFGLPYVVVRKPTPIDTKTLNYNWQNEMTAAFSVYTNKNDTIDEKSARQAVAAVLRFLTRMGIIRYESHSGYISHVIMEEDLTDVHVKNGGIFLLTYWSGIVDETDLCYLGGTPHDLMDVMGFRSMEIDGLYDGEWNEGIPEPENPLYLERAYRCSHLCELVQPSTAEVLMTYGKDFYDGMPAMTRNVYGKGKAYAVCADFEQGLYDEVCRKLAEEAGVERIVEEVPEGVEVTMREQKDGTRYVFVQNFSREAVEVKLPIERYPVWQGTYDGTIGSWKTIVLKGR